MAKPVIKEVGEELTERTTKELRREVVEKIKKEEAGHLVKGEQNVFPHGFENIEQFNKAVSDIRASLKVDDATVGVRGSSVTGVKFKSGESFDASSDIDFFVISDKLYLQGLEKGTKGSNDAFKVGATMKYFPEIHEIEKILTKRLGRDVTVRIFNQEGFQAVKVGQEILVR